jgi:hypothetical protein
MPREASDHATEPPLSTAEQVRRRGFRAWPETVAALAARELTADAGLSQSKRDLEILVRSLEVHRSGSRSET